MENWKLMVENKLKKEKNSVASINIEKESVSYAEEIKHNRNLRILTGDEEVVRAFVIDRLVNELDYKPENLEVEKEYTIKGGHSKINPRVDVLVKDESGNPFFFIEVKAPNKYEKDKSEIEGQLFALAQAEERDFKTKVKYLVYYTTELLDEEVVDRSIIIDFEKYKTYVDWENDGFISIGTELTAGYGEPKKQPLTKGDEKNDLRVRINREEIAALGKNLHNVLWGGGGTNDSEIFYSLVNIILAKIQDEYEKEDAKEYDFQVYQYGNNIESQNKIYERINALYKRALKQQLNVSEQQKIDDDNVINRNKFPLNKLVYTVQSLESFSFLEGRSSLDGKDVLGDFFESITRDGFKQNKGQFFTPTPIVKFILYALQLDNLAIERLNNARELPLIIDPSAGSGTYLVEAMKLITKEIKYKQKNKVKSSRQIKQRFEELFAPDNNENKWAREYLYGSEINFDLGTASKVNMILHGDGSTNIFVKDGLLPFRNYIKETSPNYLETAYAESIYNDKDVNGKFDVVVSNPPFSVDLDTQTQRQIKNTFLFGNKKNSENLFIERYYQLLKEGGRLGVVLPESIFDTTENKYIRLFLFKYFNIKAVISLPNSTFEPFTSTKTSLLFAQKKNKKEVEKWNELWEKYGKEWSLLLTRINDYNSYFVEGKELNKKWAKDVITDIEEGNIGNITKNIKRFLKDYISKEDEELSIKELLTKFKMEIINLSKYEKETNVFGFYNAWWVFGEVSKELNYTIFMAEAENIGYKRTKRGESLMPNDLYDLEYAPNELKYSDVINSYVGEINDLTGNLEQLEAEKKDLEDREKQNVVTQKKTDKLTEAVNALNSLLETIAAEKEEVENILTTFYANDLLKEEYEERTDMELISQFKNGLLSRYRSDDILLRKTTVQTILDAIRQEVVWK
ncbi:N-6 DNA methylase [Paenibacillus durus]|uniref:N-6 DNA methylase n=1 Tax=Paenibacillus durus TaxID=44251 RepID=UPI000694F567|nr:N-6 DNA methylase [Paenibacillus durus]